MRWSGLLLPVVVFTAACSAGNEADAVQRDPALRAPAPAGAPSPATAKPLGHALTGTLVERIAVSPYVYLRLNTATGELWVAVLEAPLTVGAQVTVYNALLMEQFESKTLKRTFDRIYFGSLEAPGTQPTEMAGTDGEPTTMGAPPALDAQVAPVAKATGADARTIAELWTQKDRLANTVVSVRGTVVKYNAAVMGKNWIHLQDGSGDAAKGTHDITLTTLDDVTVGATVTMTGTVRLNRDVGAGYTFPVLIEDAKVVVK
ncbi:nucleotide-binding protein [Gemmatimonas groenlandica]|uniref:Nucleotide-binding protein n=1 Tax=Gemmatimonas groenlandica TaxID=2732249 RepID=A0A6M4IUL3_9BACT|nr:nucleotide-binding protein [Gemmatimonas groenlandica]QJR37247.1 nucleotide-binding protein [Gemmatimonas groenlandica]